MNPHARSWKMDEHGEIPTKIAYAFFPKLNPHVRWYKAWKKCWCRTGWEWSNDPTNDYDPSHSLKIQFLWPIPFPYSSLWMSTWTCFLFMTMGCLFSRNNGKKTDDNNCYMTISWLWTMIITNNNYQMTITLLFNRITIYNNHYEHSSWLLPSGKPTQLWKITMFNGKIHYKWSFSIAMLNYQRV